MKWLLTLAEDLVLMMTTTNLEVIQRRKRLAQDVKKKLCRVLDPANIAMSKLMAQ
jgi:hypothetical protein